MPRPSDTSAQTVRLLRALGRQDRRWRYGYDLGKETGLKSGSLYPILIRLADRGLLETDWESEPPRGRPPRHLYRLTSAGEAHVALQEESGQVKDGTAGGSRHSLGIAG
jgi:PadR family transcriptional regulator PadR